jgi:DNA-binding response OmpR family regulator
MVEKKKLLIVDDEDAIRLLLRHELELHNFEVHEADCGEAALELLEVNKFTIVLLDIRMPGIDGIEVLRQIREKNLTDKVIMLTGVDELKIARDSLALGASDFLTKPYNIKTLLACIDRVLKE